MDKNMCYIMIAALYVCSVCPFYLHRKKIISSSMFYYSQMKNMVGTRLNHRSQSKKINKGSLFYRLIIIFSVSLLFFQPLFRNLSSEELNYNGINLELYIFLISFTFIAGIFPLSEFTTILRTCFFLLFSFLYFCFEQTEIINVIFLQSNKLLSTDYNLKQKLLSIYFLLIIFISQFFICFGYIFVANDMIYKFIVMIERNNIQQWPTMSEIKDEKVQQLRLQNSQKLSQSQRFLYQIIYYIYGIMFLIFIFIITCYMVQIHPKNHASFTHSHLFVIQLKTQISFAQSSQKLIYLTKSICSPWIFVITWPYFLSLINNQDQCVRRRLFVAVLFGMLCSFFRYISEFV